MSTIINILTTNDIHGRFHSKDHPGILEYARLASYKKEFPNCLLIDAGDATQGTPFVTICQGFGAIKVMNDIGYDIITLGNHEFENISGDNGDTHELDKIILNSTASYICANVLWNDSDEIRNKTYINYLRKKEDRTLDAGRYTVKEIEGKKLLFIGLCTPMMSTEIEKMKGFSIVGKKAVDVVNVVRDAISDAKKQYSCEKFDAVILLAHIGKSTSGVNTEAIVENLSAEDNVCLIIDGHSHEKYEETYCKNGKNITITQGDCYSKYFRHIKLEFIDDKPIIKSAELHSNNHIQKYPIDKCVDKTLNDIKTKVDERFGTVYSKGAKTTLWGGAINEDEPYVPQGLEALNITRFVQTNLGKLAAEAMIYAARIDFNNKIAEDDYIIAGINGGGVRDSIPFGKKITGNELFFTLPSLLDSEKESGYALFKISIAKLKELLEHSIKGLVYREDERKLVEGSGAFLNTAGIKYTIQYNSKTKKISIGDTAILTCNKKSDDMCRTITFSEDKNETILLCVNKYIAGGGDGYVLKDQEKIDEKKNPAMYELAGKYIAHLSGGMRLDYPAASKDITYEGFDFTTDDVTITFKDENGVRINQGTALMHYLGANGVEKFKNESFTNELTITPLDGAFTLSIELIPRRLRGEVFLHSYFSLKNRIECMVYADKTGEFSAVEKELQE